MEWLAVDPMPVKRETAAVLSLNNAIYVIGGFDGSDRCRQILVFNTDTNTWELGGTLSYPRSCLGAAVIPMSGPRRKITSIPRRHKRKSEEKMETENGKIGLVLVHVRSKFPLPENE
ncbi:kelch repeat protein [Ancylostoma caninum]|uniref:Kelch repeat protein n=1 Tax=Ancylostoma caninum TaxID=29170 RepID=A0A368EXT9_ANCCA|nr:kelch repeat protein [Ancylostoma caninum]